LFTLRDEGRRQITLMSSSQGYVLHVSSEMESVELFGLATTIPGIYALFRSRLPEIRRLVGGHLCARAFVRVHEIYLDRSRFSDSSLEEL
jgi:hypothetical protein